MSWYKNRINEPTIDGWYVAKNSMKHVHKYLFKEGMWYGGTLGITRVFNIIEWKENQIMIMAMRRQQQYDPVEDYILRYKLALDILEAWLIQEPDNELYLEALRCNYDMIVGTQFDHHIHNLLHSNKEVM